MPKDRFWTAKFAWLRYAVAWIWYAFMRSIVHVPFAWQLAFGRGLGSTAYWLLPSRRQIVARNLEICFPELSAEARQRIMHQHFRALGASLMEMAMGWFGDVDAVQRRVRIEGAEHLQAGLQRSRGVILFSAHFTSFEIFWPVLSSLCPRLCGMYKWQRNPVMNKIMTRSRSRFFDTTFNKDNVRQMLRSLRDNAVVWYASDQSYGGKGTALIPFFGEPAMTNTAISRLAKASGATVLPYFCRRLPNDTYLGTIGPPLGGFPSNDPVTDTRRLIETLEDFIRLCPEQYWWVHARFKGRPESMPDAYAVSPP